MALPSKWFLSFWQARDFHRIWTPPRMKLRTFSSLLFLFGLLLSAHAATSPKDLLAAGRADDAIQALEQQVTQSPTDAEAYNLLCRAYFMIEEWDRGIAACERARTSIPRRAFITSGLGASTERRPAVPDLLLSLRAGKESSHLV